MYTLIFLHVYLVGMGFLNESPDFISNDYPGNNIFQSLQYSHSFSLFFYLYQQILYNNPIFLILQEKTQTKPSLCLGVLTLVVSQ